MTAIFLHSYLLFNVLYVSTLLLSTYTFSFPLTCVIVRSAFFYIAKVSKNMSRVLKMLSSCHLPKRKLKLILAIRLMRKPYREFFPLLERASTRMSYTQSNLESEMPGECSGSCLIRNRIAAVCN